MASDLPNWPSVIDKFLRKCLTLTVDCRTRGDITDTLSALLVMRGVPEHILSDIGRRYNAYNHRA